MGDKGLTWHIVTGEYPPLAGGVSDYSFLIARDLARAGDSVHVWCPAVDGSAPKTEGVTVHAELGALAGADLSRIDRLLMEWPGPRKLLVQWVPHAFGRRSLNVGFCLWLWRRARRHGDSIEIMVHEPFLSFRKVRVRHNVAAAVQRLMTMILLNAADRVWVAAPLWERWWRPYSLGRSVRFEWLPIPSNVPVVRDEEEIARVRDHYCPPSCELIGHFGTYGREVTKVLADALPTLLGNSPQRRLLLLGRGGASFREELLRSHPSLAERVHAPGGMAASLLSTRLQAVDVLIQPYPGGVNSRRGSLMAGLAHRLPVVTTDGSLTEPIWAESGVVRLVPDGDLAALVSAAEHLLADPDERERLASAAIEFYNRCFNLSVSIERLRASRSETRHRGGGPLVSSCDLRF